jgi:hypothetical protein
LYKAFKRKDGKNTSNITGVKKWLKEQYQKKNYRK